MIFYIQFVGLKKEYIKVKAPNKSAALAQVSKYRKDAIVYSNEKIFSFEDAEGFSNWKQITIEELSSTKCNTRERWMIISKDQVVEYKELREDELLEYLKTKDKKGVLFEPEKGKRFFCIKDKGKQVALYAVARIKSIPSGYLETKEKEEPKLVEKIEASFEVV